MVLHVRHQSKQNGTHSCISSIVYSAFFIQRACYMSVFWSVNPVTVEYLPVTITEGLLGPVSWWQSVVHTLVHDLVFR